MLHLVERSSGIIDPTLGSMDMSVCVTGKHSCFPSVWWFLTSNVCAWLVQSGSSISLRSSDVWRRKCQIEQLLVSPTAARRRVLSVQLSVEWAGYLDVVYHAALCGEFGYYWCYSISVFFSAMRLGVREAWTNSIYKYCFSIGYATRTVCCLRNPWSRWRDPLGGVTPWTSTQLCSWWRYEFVLSRIYMRLLIHHCIA